MTGSHLLWEWLDLIGQGSWWSLQAVSQPIKTFLLVSIIGLKIERRVETATARRGPFDSCMLL